MRLEHERAPIAAAMARFAAEDYLLLSAITLLPWAFGGVELWAMRLGAFLIGSAAAVALWKRGWTALGLDRRTRWLLPAALLGLWGILQIVPLPPAVIGIVSPHADAIYTEAIPGYRGAPVDSAVLALEEQALARVPEVVGLAVPEGNELLFRDSERGRWSGWRSLSLTPTIGIERVHWYGALLIAFLLVRARTADSELAHHYRNVMFLLFAGLAVFGCVYAATRNGKLYWIRDNLGDLRPFGPFVNPTNFAALMELGVPWLLGHVLTQLRGSGRGFMNVLSAPIFASGTLICLAAGFLAGSKFAAVMLIASVTLLAVLFVRRAWVRWTVFGGAAAAWTALAILLRESLLGERLEEVLAATGGSLGELSRLTAWKASLPMLQDYLVTGVGYGAFEGVFQRYVAAGAEKRWEAAHNDYLEVLLEGGLVGAVLLVWLAYGFWSRVLRSKGSRARTDVDFERAGLLLGLASLSVHAFVDFNHQIPADALLFVSLAAIAVAGAERTAGDAP